VALTRAQVRKIERRSRRMRPMHQFNSKYIYFRFCLLHLKFMLHSMIDDGELLRLRAFSARE
jgi:hypothetical protein